MTVKIEKLVRMGEQITDNMRFTEDEEVVAERVADHLSRFWDPRMKASIIEFAESHGDDLSPPFRRAVGIIAAA